MAILGDPTIQENTKTTERNETDANQAEGRATASVVRETGEEPP